MNAHRYGSASRWFVIACVCVASMASVGAAAAEEFSPEVAAMRDAARAAGIPESQLPRQLPAEIRAAKPTRAMWERKLSSQILDRLDQLRGADVLSAGRLHLAQEYSTATVQIDDRGRLLVECRVDDTRQFPPALFARFGGQLVQAASGWGFLVAWIPADRMEEFASRSDVRYVTHIEPPETDLGAALSQGDAVHNADDARADFGIDGTGLTVGVISDGVTNLAAAQGSGDLPAALNVPAGCTGNGDEGTAMLEIVADLAPGAALNFCTGFPGTTGMVNAITTLAAIAGMDIITDDLPHLQEPLFEDGPIAQAKQAAAAAGIFYTASAGNRANQHFEGDYNSPNANVTVGPNVYANPHDFGGGDVRLSITLAAQNSIFLKWAEAFGAAAIDLDLYVVDNAGNVLASSTGNQTGTENPAESVGFASTAGTAAHIIVDYVGGGAAPTVFFDLRATGQVQWNEYLVRPGSINGASRQPEIYAAGAADWSTPGTINGFSSRGPIRRYFPGPLVTRNKPDGTAVDGVTVTGAGCFACPPGCPPVPPIGSCNFGGTSAATPHVAAMAALLLEEVPGLTPAQVANAFNTTAVDIDAPGQDNNSGFGRLDVRAAICSFDDDAPTLMCPPNLVVECTSGGGTPASHPQITAFLAGATATDVCDPSPLISHNATAFFPVGITVVTFTAIDDNNNQSQCMAQVEVVDTSVPTITVELSRSTLWPPNHKLVAIHADVTATDVCDPDPDVVLVSVTSDEPDNGTGDGDTPNDIQDAAIGTEDYDLLLRSERMGGGDGRIYVVCYGVTDASGNVASACDTVRVPHDRSGVAELKSEWESYELVVIGTVETPVRAVTPGRVRMGSDEFLDVSASAVPVRYQDHNSDGIEDAYFSFGPTEQAAIRTESQRTVLYARWEAGDVGYLAAVQPTAVAVTPPATRPTELAAYVRPNPALGTAVIRYALPTDARVELAVFDLAGRMVSKLVDGTMPAGHHEVPWRSNGTAATQLYMYRLEALGRSLTGRFVVLK